MSLNERTHQFTHSNTQRRASIVYGSIGKGSLFTPSDFIRPSEDTADARFDDDQEFEPHIADESSQLLNRPVTAGKLKFRRKSSVTREIIEQERIFLQDNKIKIPLQGSEEDVIDAFEDAIISKKISTTTSSIELKSLIISSIPLVVTFLLQNSLSTVSVFTVGHLGAVELAAVSMGSMTANITGYATIQGIATALDTLCPQAFGAKKYLLVGVYLQKCTTLIVTIMTPVLIIWIFFGYELITLILPDKDTAKYAAVYLQYIAPGIPAYILFECGKRFLQSQGIYHISTIVLLFAAPSNLLMNLLFVKHLGYIGAPIAVAINYWFMAIGLFVATVYLIKPESTPTGLHPLVCWGGLNIKESFKAWDKLAYLAIPGLIMLEAEFLAFEILTLLASYLGTVPLAAQSIGITMASLTYQVPFAIGIASSTRIANFLGAGLGAAAKTTTQVSISFGLVISTFNFLLLFCFQTQIAELFTDDEEVIKTVEGVMWLIALMQISDAMNANSAGCLRGQGQTKIGGIVNLISYYLVGLPLSIYITFYSKYGGTLHGLWIGSCVALTIIGIVQSYYALFADYDKLCADARERISDEVPGFSV